MSSGMSTTLATLLEQKRRQIAQIQEEIATLERAQALLAGRPVRPTGPAAATAPRPVGTRPAPAGPSLRTLVLDMVRTSATPLAPRAILAKLAARGRRVTRGRITSLLSELIRNGTLRRPSPGLYAPASSSATSTAPPAPPSGSTTASPSRPHSAPRASRPAKPAGSAKRPRRR
jgi:hypothetical protein